MRVVNLRIEQCDIRADRRSILGNPFRMSGESDRARVIAEHRKYLWNVLNGGLPYRGTRDEFMREFERIEEGKTLGCWCAPKACHCDTLIAAKRWWDGRG